MHRTFCIERIQTGERGIQYWLSYDDEIYTLAEGNERMRFLIQNQPDCDFRLIEILSHSVDLRQAHGGSR